MAERITAQKVYEYVREQIVSKALFPGNRIVEDELAEALHTSRTTVRNGIAILSYNGLVDVISNYGTFVTKPTLSDMEQAYAVRGDVTGVVSDGMGAWYFGALWRVEQ